LHENDIQLMANGKREMKINNLTNMFKFVDDYMKVWGCGFTLKVIIQTLPKQRVLRGNNCLSSLEVITADWVLFYSPPFQFLRSSVGLDSRHIMISIKS